ncbi:LuxR C-terminal-related transcriptional regulator [Streptomyces sp. L2]|uniref:ATP-binding protein n=1 Tax=Streptomyces sp. L2 TaxID=2162665 RepID=UPI001F50A834|nr:LuxR C-terminal-related transcriptional regulator [Streptomyces sp. L2]
MLTLMGPGGIGKTRLALEYAREQRSSGGTPLLVELAGLAEGSDPVQAVAAVLGVGEHGGRSGVEALAHAVGGRELLLLLDNCEHVVRGVARLVADLLGRCSGLRVLATSREALRVPGEVVLRIGELDMGTREGGVVAPGPLPTGRPKPDAVQLFAERATASAPGFRPSGDDIATIVKICRRLEGMPLAIELAARRTASLPLGAILAGLDDQLALLADGSRTGPARHLDLTAAIDWSHRLLTGPEQVLFRRLSVLRGGFTAESAAAVAADGSHGPLQNRRILPLLLALEAKSLIVRTPDPGRREGFFPGPGRAGKQGHNAGQQARPVRFRQLETIRAYALERLEESGELEETRERAAQWLAGLVAPSLDAVYTEDTAARALAERENLAALVTSPEMPSEPPPVLVLALARVRFREGQLTAARALLEAGPEWSDTCLQVVRLASASRVTCHQGDGETALSFGEKAVALARCLDHRGLLANALDARACARLVTREFPLAAEDFRTCANVLDTLDRQVDVAAAHDNLAWALLLARRPAEANTLVTGCLPVLREHAPSYVLAVALHTAGAIRLALEDWPGAEGLFAESLGALSIEGYQGPTVVEGLAAVATARGQYRRAVRLFTAAARSRLESEIAPGWRDQIAPFKARATAALPPAARRAAETAGQGMDWPDLAAYALGETEEASAPASRPGTAGLAGLAGPLTARETAVAELVARGLTNREIGTRLNVSPRTVDARLNRVRDKLGVRSRTEIAHWLARHHTTASNS